MPQRVLVVLSLLSASVLAQSQGCGPATGRDSAASFNKAGLTTHSAAVKPAFSDTFSSGALDTTKWFIDTGNAPGNIAGVNLGTLSADHVDLSTGMLRLTLTQTVSGALATSVGAEIRSKQLFGYGTYVWVARAASTSAVPKAAGSAVSGSVTDVFNYMDDSQTEIDFEYEGQLPSTLEMTNYSGVSNSQTSSATASGADESFHEYKFIWSAAKIEFYVDGALVSTHTQHIPSVPAAALINLWGTNSKSFGGIATSGVTRYLYVSSFSYTPLLK